MTLYVHASTAASTAAAPHCAQPWDRYNSAGPLAGPQSYNSAWQSAAEGNPASPYQQGEMGAQSCGMAYDGSQAWGGCYGGAYSSGYGNVYGSGYSCGAYGGYGGYGAAYGAQGAGGYGAQSACLNLDQYSDASDSEDEVEPQEKLAPKEAPAVAAAAAAAKVEEARADERSEPSTAEVAEPAPEPALGGGRPQSPSPPSSPDMKASVSPASPPTSPLCSEADETASAAASEPEASSASEPEAEASAKEADASLTVARPVPWRRSITEPALKVSPSSWAAQQRARRKASEGGDQDYAEVIRNMKSILNKLTVEKFPVLYQKLVASGIQTAILAEALIREVFEKATTQHHFVDMYADLCALLQEHYEQHPVTDDSKFSFRRLLLNECQASFERNLAPPSELDALDAEERTLVEFRYKTRMIGNIRFVGALFARKMLASKVMFAIIEELLAHATPEALESLATLLTVVGPTFDRPEWTYHDLLCAVFQQIKAITAKADCNPRVKCLLKDVLDLRSRGWQDTRPKRCEGPTTLQDVARQKAAEDWAAAGRTCTRGRVR